MTPAAHRAEELVREARIESLPDVTGFLEAACTRAGVDQDTAFALRLAVEEAFTNVVEHGYRGEPGPVTLTFRSDPDRVTVTVADRAPPFAPEDAPPPDLDSGWEERRVGGLGWHLIREVMDEVHHAPATGGGNVLTLVKRLPPTPG